MGIYGQSPTGQQSFSGQFPPLLQASLTAQQYTKIVKRRKAEIRADTWKLSPFLPTLQSYAENTSLVAYKFCRLETKMSSNFSGLPHFVQSCSVKKMMFSLRLEDGICRKSYCFDL